MEISLTLNNTLVFNKEFTSKDIFNGVGKGIAISAIISIGVYCSRQLLLSKDFWEGINGTYSEFLGAIYEELFLLPDEIINRSIEQDVKTWFPIDTKTWFYLGGKSVEAIKMDIENEAIPVLKLLSKSIGI